MWPLKFVLLAFALLLAVPGAAAAQTPANAPWIVIADSITTFPHGGNPRDLPWPIITQERGVVFNSIGGPAAVMGATGMAGYNDNATTATMDRICGYFSYCSGVILQAGVNDFQNDITWAAHRASILRVLTWAQARNKRVLMLDLIYNRDAEQGAPTNDAGLTFTEIRNNRFLECYARGPVCVFAQRPANLSALTPGFYQTDGTHLTPAGRRAMATWVESAAAAAGLF